MPTLRCLSALRLLAVMTVALVSSAADRPPAKAPAVPAALPPEVEILQPGVKLTMLAEHPALVTPTGIDVDAGGRIWVVSSHTHFRPEGYAGPAYDEVLVFNRDGAGRKVFYSKTTATMDLELGRDGWVYLAERSRILRVKDTDGDGVGDTEETLATLRTEADYPHNGLSGFAWHPDGDLVFSLGENMWKQWMLTGRDGSSVAGSGEGGIFRCKPDGTQMRRIAKGFWNPFGVTVRDDGEMFAVENDPGSRPPCRLLHIVEGGDYGYQRNYGEAPFHPFVAWNGELRGTLPMLHASGEAPCGIVTLGGGVLGLSWGDHRVDFYPLRRSGAGFETTRLELLRGGNNFRPVCIARGPDGAFYLTDWVYTSYELHGRGRLWKLEIDPRAASWLTPAKPGPPTAESKLAAELRAGKAKLTEARLFELARGRDAFLSDAAVQSLARSTGKWTLESLRKLGAADRAWALLALKRATPDDERWPRAFLNDPDPEVRFECVRWIADACFQSFTPDIERMLASADLDYRLFEALLAAANTLRGESRAGVTDVNTLVSRLNDRDTSATVKGYALRLVPPTHAKLKVPFLEELLAVNDPVLSLESVRTLAAQDKPEGVVLLAGIAADEKRPAALRAEAVAGLASSTDDHRALLVKLAADSDRTIRHESLRALRAATLDGGNSAALRTVMEKFPESRSLVEAVLKPGAYNEGRPEFADTTAWQKRLDALPGQPDAESGRRIFFHSRVALCSSCHRHSGRGVLVGPDLSAVADRGDPAWLLQSILQPSREVAPQFFPVSLGLKDGNEFVGFLLRKGGQSGKEFYRDVAGREQGFLKDDIVHRRELRTSVMPEGLAASLTDEELRDLLAFLMPARGAK